jgi:hypothetical protein
MRIGHYKKGGTNKLRVVSEKEFKLKKKTCSIKKAINMEE